MGVVRDTHLPHAFTNAVMSDGAISAFACDSPDTIKVKERAQVSKIVLCEQRTKNGDSLLIGLQFCDKKGLLILAVGTCTGPRKEVAIADGERVLGFKFNQATATG